MRITSFSVFLCITYLLTFKTGFGETKCLYPWIEFQKHCYLFRLDKKTWFESKVECNKKNSYLARVETPAEDDWIIQQIFALNKMWYLWIGGNTLRKVGDWRWESTNENVGYRFFHPFEPDKPTIQRCLGYVLHRRMLYWGDLLCEDKKWFMWIGGNTLKKVGDWRWESTNEKVGHRFFHPSEPSTATRERCLVYFSFDRKILYWGVYTCTNNNPGFICERES